jgi:sulfur transfer complex TusBCD TusB component (DsrH family)
MLLSWKSWRSGFPDGHVIEAKAKQEKLSRNSSMYFFLKQDLMVRNIRQLIICNTITTTTDAAYAYLGEMTLFIQL